MTGRQKKEGGGSPPPRCEKMGETATNVGYYPRCFVVRQGIGKVRGGNRIRGGILERERSQIHRGRERGVCSEKKKRY